MQNITQKTLKKTEFETVLGIMVAIGDEHVLYLLEFTDKPKLEHEIQKLQTTLNALITGGCTKPIASIQNELALYFAGTLIQFKTPVQLVGSPFQKTVWQELCNTPYGQTRSYKDQATVIGNEKACRAVGNTNGTNQLVIIVPCHRIITTNGKLGGYSCGIARKQWLLNHEKRFKAL